MVDRFEAGFIFKDKPYMAYVYIVKTDEGFNYIVNIFDRVLNQEYPKSYTFKGIDNKFILAKDVSEDELELINIIKQAIRDHPENKYKFID